MQQLLQLDIVGVALVAELQRERCGPPLMRSDGEKIQIRQQKKRFFPNLSNLAQEKKIRAIIWHEMSVNTKAQ